MSLGLYKYYVPMRQKRAYVELWYRAVSSLGASSCGKLPVNWRNHQRVHHD